MFPQIRPPIDTLSNIALANAERSHTKSATSADASKLPSTKLDSELAKSKASADRGRFVSWNTCARIDHEKWPEITPGLSVFMNARMDKTLAYANLLDQSHADIKGDESKTEFCHGVTVGWFHLHNAKPDTPPIAAAKRMELLMSPEGTAHALTAQRISVAEWANPKKMERMATLKHLFNQAEERADVTNQMTHIYAMRAKPRDKGLPCSLADSAEFGRILSSDKPGYYNVSLLLKKEEASILHSLAVHVAGEDQPMAICDSNVGEGEVNAEEFPRFLAQLSKFYEDHRGAKIDSILMCQKFDIGSAENTPFENLSKELTGPGR